MKFFQKLGKTATFGTAYLFANTVLGTVYLRTTEASERDSEMKLKKKEEKYDRQGLPHKRVQRCGESFPFLVNGLPMGGGKRYYTTVEVDNSQSPSSP